MKNTIMIVSNVTNGLYNFRRELISILSQDYQVYIYATVNGRKDELEALGAHVTDTGINIKGTNPLADLQSVSYYKNEMRKIHPFIVLTYTIKPNIYAGMAAAALGIPQAANITGLGTAVENPGLLQKITVPLYRIGLRKTAKVYFQNKSNMDFMLERNIVKNKQCELIPGSGVNLEKFIPLPYPDGDTVDFVFISRIIREKGIDEYLEAAKHFRKRNPETRFHVCGSMDESYKGIIDEAVKNGTIIYHGQVKDIVGMHRICSCTVHPSFYPEGMSNTLLESCACARPIITTTRPGCGEIIEDGKNGFAVREKDCADLISKIEKFLSLSKEEKSAMGQYGRNKVEREFDRNIVINRYLDLIHSTESCGNGGQTI